MRQLKLEQLAAIAEEMVSDEIKQHDHESGFYDSAPMDSWILCEMLSDRYPDGGYSMELFKIELASQFEKRDPDGKYFEIDWGMYE